MPASQLVAPLLPIAHLSAFVAPDISSPGALHRWLRETDHAGAQLALAAAQRRRRASSITTTAAEVASESFSPISPHSYEHARQTSQPVSPQELQRALERQRQMLPAELLPTASTPSNSVLSLSAITLDLTPGGSRYPSMSPPATSPSASTTSSAHMSRSATGQEMTNGASRGDPAAIEFSQTLQPARTRKEKVIDVQRASMPAVAFPDLAASPNAAAERVRALLQRLLDKDKMAQCNTADPQIDILARQVLAICWLLQDVSLPSWLLPRLCFASAPPWLQDTLTAQLVSELAPEPAVPPLVDEMRRTLMLHLGLGQSQDLQLQSDTRLAGCLLVPFKRTKRAASLPPAPTSVRLHNLIAAVGHCSPATPRCAEARIHDALPHVCALLTIDEPAIGMAVHSSSAGLLSKIRNCLHLSAYITEQIDTIICTSNRR